MHDRTLERLWHEAVPATRTFHPAMVDGLPEPARRYFLHALAPHARLSTALRLTMRGELRLEGVWYPFDAEQVLNWDRGFVWHAHARVKGLAVSGYDRLVDGDGAMRWRVLGLIPFLRAGGHDVARSAAGRMHAESLWFPAVLLGDDVQWLDGDGPRAVMRAHGELSELQLELDPEGGVRTLSLARWTDVASPAVQPGQFHYERFGGYCDTDRTFGGVTIPTRYRVGWYFGSERFETEGEFIRLTIETATYR